MRVLLLAPPGKKIYLRDNFCGLTSKGDYYYPPSDLLIQSGILSRECDVHVLDSIAENLSAESAKKRILAVKPDAIFSLSSAISMHEDLPFLRGLKEILGCKIIISGDIFFFEPKALMERYPFIDGITLNYTNEDVAHLLMGRLAPISSMAFRKGTRLILRQGRTAGEHSYPPQRVELFPNSAYSYPFMRRRLLGAISTSFGCPFKCTFCSQGMIPFSFRSLDNTILELEYLQKKGIRELFIKDFTFNVDINRTKKLLRMMIQHKFAFSWTCEMVAASFDKELVQLLKKAGCHTIMFGVESGNDDILKSTGKNVTTARIREVFDDCNRMGIRTLGHFIIGLPQDSRKTIEDTIRFARDIHCTFAVFNLYVPRLGSNIGNEIYRNSKASDLSRLDCSADRTVSYMPTLKAAELLSYRRKAYLLFYLNPMRAMAIISSIRTLTEARVLFKNFIRIFG